ncbi:V-type ATP synthase subunit B [Lutispora saccharofermentans]|uniref:V-type ATP synthase beta chain n=1 Tax=Lutispora saccharofermentans TaxID=3024236 RepID=A0ABT1ND73_9FIRM|nr:V-type ATP synthase subunit B [Lutispora saccharofermentans]MCQ1529215.1 V-type ATP synthase subunit B [Lutispora saccharofermentans]
MKMKYLKISKVEGPLIILEGVKDAAYDEMVEIEVEGQSPKKGKVVQINRDKVIIQVFEGTTGVSLNNARVSFAGKPLEISLSKEVLGRVFNGIGEPTDGAPLYLGKKYDIHGRPMNPVARFYPRNFIQTGISTIDGLTTLIRGQKLPIFSGDGLPHNELAAQIVRQAKITESQEDNFAVVFAAMGIKHGEAEFFRKSFQQSGVLKKVVMYANLADDPIIERITTPRCALTAAEYLAFEENMHVLVIMTNITSYCEALREISASREEVPSRKGYPGYLYSDLATLYERAGMMKGKKGSITQIPILTMPNDDITHPVPDLTGYITEGQIILSRDLYQRDIYPPVNVLPSLSRLMKDGIGEGYTREDHPDVANQVFSAYSRVQDIRSLAQVIGEEELSDTDKKYLEFGKQFERQFVKQGYDENRNLERTLDLMWELLKILPKSELNRVKPEYIDKYMEAKDGK